MNGPIGVDVQFMTYDPCSPLLSVPSEVYKIDTAWLNCTAGISGLWDPPRVLLSASDPLTPDPTMTSQAEPTFISSAVPASIVTPNTPTVTTSAGPSPKPPQAFSASSSISDDSGSSSKSGNNRDPASKPQSGPSQDPSLLPEPGLSVDPGASVANNGGSGGSIQGDAELQGQYGKTGSHTAIVLPSQDFSVNGATITADTAPITLDNSPTSIGSSYAIIGTSSLNLPIGPPNLPSSDGHPVEITPNGHVVVAGLTLSQGGSATIIAGTVVSLGVDGLTVGTSTFTESTSASILTLPLVGGQKVHVGANGDVVIAETTLLSGKPGVMVSGTPITLWSQRLDHRVFRICSTSSLIRSNAFFNRASASPKSCKWWRSDCRYNAATCHSRYDDLRNISISWFGRINRRLIYLRSPNANTSSHIHHRRGNNHSRHLLRLLARRPNNFPWWPRSHDLRRHRIPRLRRPRRWFQNLQHTRSVPRSTAAYHVRRPSVHRQLHR